MDNNKFAKFLKDTTSQQELSLIIAENDDELTQLKDTLVKNGYTFPTNILLTISDLNNQNKICFVIKDEGMAKILYDFALQYPTGQINLFDEKAMKNIVVTPDYNDKSLVLLATENQLKNLQRINFDFFAVSGIAYRDKE